MITAALVAPPRPRHAPSPAPTALARETPETALPPAPADPTKLMRYASIALGAAGAAVQVGYGLKQLRAAETHHQRFNGAADIATGVARGTASMVTFGAGIAAASGLASVASAVAVYGLCHCGSIGLDGARDLYNARHTHSKQDLQSGLVKLAAVSFMAASLGMNSSAGVVAGSFLADAAVMVQNRREIAQAITNGAKAVRQRLFPHRP